MYLQQHNTAQHMAQSTHASPKAVLSMGLATHLGAFDDPCSENLYCRWRGPPRSALAPCCSVGLQQGGALQLISCGAGVQTRPRRDSIQSACSSAKPVPHWHTQMLLQRRGPAGFHMRSAGLPGGQTLFSGTSWRRRNTRTLSCRQLYTLACWLTWLTPCVTARIAMHLQSIMLL